MTDAPGADALQFDRAEPVAGGIACANCKRTIEGQYWTLNQLRLCHSCSIAIRSGLDLRAGAWPRAVAFGLGAAAAGAVLWFVIEKFLHLRLGLVAVAIGWMVGKAIRKATGPRSGPGFQALALALTYLSIAASNLLAFIAATDDLSHVPILGMGLTVLTFPITSASPIGLFIIGIALYEAWRFSKGVTVQVLGPFPLAAPVAPPVESSPHA